MFEELVKKSKDGDKKAKEEIIKRLQPLIISSIKRYYYNKNEFEDLMQEGNLKILESIDLYDEDKGVYFLGYIKTMLKYMYLDKHKEKSYISLNEKVGDGGDEIIDLLVSNDNGVLEDLVFRENINDLREKLKILTERQRAIIILFYIKKYSIAEIAQKLGVSYRTVVNTKTVGLKNLRKIILK